MFLVLHVCYLSKNRIISVLLSPEFGDKEIQTLVKQFEEPLQLAGISIGAIAPEFLSLKTKLFQEYP